MAITAECLLICGALLHWMAIDGVLALPLGGLVDPAYRLANPVGGLHIGNRNGAEFAGDDVERCLNVRPRRSLEAFTPLNGVPWRPAEVGGRGAQGNREQHLRLRLWMFAIALVVVDIFPGRATLVVVAVIVAASRRAKMVLALVAVNALFFAIDKWGKQYFEGRLQGLYLNLRDPRAYQLLTSMMCHDSTQHLMKNLLYFFVCGMEVETQVGPWGLLIAFLFCGVGANIVGLLSAAICSRRWWCPTHALGASGAVSGLVTFAFYLMDNSRVEYYDTLPLFVVALYIFSPAVFDVMLFIHFGGHPAVHLGGAFAGLLMSLSFRSFRFFELPT
ncbi:hypothetical protein T484DRAFT_1952646 [Baffinella frigidus]|nr:hypothetical protein T484DRAFT_1952646 [Cryptophyta sp. CCMP2293]|mmetsp:Transcript_43697/g.103803  ORF Transcript_43697/g.103803 Transcript_43697/m.103803 type:complete len:332 (+) Transcript_43697:45-1040(+)